MPAEGISYLPKLSLLSLQEIGRLITIFAGLGITKVRITGGEPFVRTDLIAMLRMIRSTAGIDDLHITTNGVLTGRYVKELKDIGIASVNLSLDTIDARRFHEITRRDEFGRVWETFEQLMKYEVPTKLNVVVMQGKNIDDILPMVELTKDIPVSVRFIEEMPFNGEGMHYPVLEWTHKKILAHIREGYPSIVRSPDPDNATAAHYRVPGHKGTIGIIASYTRSFCGTCNRIRVTANGMLKTCLYDDGVLNIRDLLRSEDDEIIKLKLLTAFRSRPANGFEAERQRASRPIIMESMSTIGG